MKKTYPYEKFMAAVHGMAASPKSVQQRIADAYLSSIMHAKSNEVPEEMRGIFEQLHRRLTSVEPQGDEGRVQATVRKMSPEDAISIINDITHIYYAIILSYYE